MEAAIQKALSDLIATCRDSEEGFGKAAKGVHRDDLREMLTQISRERADFSDEIEAMLRRMGVEPAGHTHAGGIRHRGWIDLEARIRPKDDSELVQNCERGEETTLKHYEHALAQALPEETRRVVDKQAEAIRQVLARLRAMVQVTSMAR